MLIPVFGSPPTVDDSAMYTGFGVVILGGLGSIVGCALGGMIMEIVTVFAFAYTDGVLAPVFPFIVLFVVLVVKPDESSDRAGGSRERGVCRLPPMARPKEARRGWPAAGDRYRTDDTFRRVYFVFLALALVMPGVLNSGYDLNVLVDMATNVSLATGLAIVVRTGRMSLAQATFAGIGGSASRHPRDAAGVGLLAGPARPRSAIERIRRPAGPDEPWIAGVLFRDRHLCFQPDRDDRAQRLDLRHGRTERHVRVALPARDQGFEFSDPRVYYYFVLAVALVSLLLYYLCSLGTRFGRGVSVLGEDEVLAGALGVPATTYRLIAFAILSFVGGIAGSLHTHFIQGISPPDLALSISVSLLVMVMAGGSRTLMGPAVGAAILTAVPELLRASYFGS